MEEGDRLTWWHNSEVYLRSIIIQIGTDVVREAVKVIEKKSHVLDSHLFFEGPYSL
jgi:hypothetical protein